MVIFHSYVRLPEGNMIVGGENSPKPTLAAVFFHQRFQDSRGRHGASQ